MLASVAVIYGTNFAAIKYLDEANVDVSIVTAIRFALASLALCPFLYKAPWPVVLRGIEVGVWVSAGYIAQAIGLQTTQASKSAFICSLAVVVVPIVNAIIYKKKAPPTTWLASLLAVAGVGLLTLEGKGNPPCIGDLWSLGQPLGFGIAFVRTEQCMQANKGEALAMTASQMAAVLACSMLWVSFTLTANTPDISVLYEPVNLAALFYTGVITSGVAVVAESVALAHISAEETTVILSTEPLWAALFGSVVLGETMSGFGYLGGAVILLGCLVTQLKLPKSLEKLLKPWGEGEEEEGEDEAM
jgi:drug/metabolite transporter (DMT)-like permease